MNKRFFKRTDGSPCSTCYRRPGLPKGILECGLAFLVAHDGEVDLLQSGGELAVLVLAPPGHPAAGTSPILEWGNQLGYPSSNDIL